VYFKNKLLSNDTLSSPLVYRILTYIFKHGNTSCEIFDIIENCWLYNKIKEDVEELKQLQEREKSGELTSEQGFYLKTSKYRKGISLTNNLLKEYLNISLLSGRTGSWSFDPYVPKYCVIEISD
jgi:hypothetical protein